MNTASQVLVTVLSHTVSVWIAHLLGVSFDKILSVLWQFLSVGGWLLSAGGRLWRGWPGSLRGLHGSLGGRCGGLWLLPWGFPLLRSPAGTLYHLGRFSLDSDGGVLIWHFGRGWKEGLLHSGLEELRRQADDGGGRLGKNDRRWAMFSAWKKLKYK
jgi:hypothetical protein